jgi:hypothetical protein
MAMRTIQLDEHRGTVELEATEIRRLLQGVEADQSALKQRLEALEVQLSAAPSATWLEAAEKSRYLIGLLAGTAVARDPQRKKLIVSVLEDLRRLSRDEEERRSRS